MGNCVTILKNVETIPLSFPSVKYEDVKEQIKPFDVVLFRSNDLVSTLISNVQKMTTGHGCFTHAALIVMGEFVGRPELGDRLLTLEITLGGKLNDGVTDIDGKVFLGVQLRYFDEVIKHSEKVGWLKLRRNPIEYYDQVEIKELKQKCTEVFNEISGDPYVRNICILLRASIGNSPYTKYKKDKKGIRNRFFCSELVAYVLKKIGVLDDRVNCKNVLPVDFIPDVDTNKEINCCENPIIITN